MEKNKTHQQQKREYGDLLEELANKAFDASLEFEKTARDGLLLGDEVLSQKDQASLLVRIGGAINLNQKTAGYLDVNIKTSCHNAIRRIAKEVKKKATTVGGSLLKLLS